MKRIKFTVKMSPLLVATLIVPLVSLYLMSSCTESSQVTLSTTTQLPIASTTIKQKLPDPAGAKSSKPKTARSQPRATNQPSGQLRTTAAPMDPLVPKELRMMLGFNNTPPLFVTATRDFLVDVVKHSPGSKITTITATDLDGDRIGYSIEPANTRDASPHFIIDSTTGELRLSNKQFTYHQESSVALEPSDMGDKSSENSDDRSDEREPRVPNGDGELLSPNLYFLIVAAFDGQYQTAAELKIHVFNSSMLAHQLASTGKSPVKTDDQIEAIVRDRNNEFLAYMHGPAVTYPKFMNGDLVRPQEVDETSSTPVVSSTPPPTTTRAPAPLSPLLVQHEIPQQIAADTRPDRQQISQPIVVSLVIVCSCLLLALVVLIFLVPISVKRLRRQLKQQHGHLSQQCSTLGSSSGSGSLAHHKQNGCASTLSQFTLTSDRSTVCRQSSLDSSMAGAVTPTSQPPTQHRYNNLHHGYLTGMFNRASNALVANPVYLDHENQSQLHYPVQPPTFTVFAQQARPYLVREEPSMLHAQSMIPQPPGANEVYYPIDDEFYSTINTDPSIIEPIETAGNRHAPDQTRYRVGEHPIPPAEICYQTPLEDSCGSQDASLIDSRNSESRLSTRSLTKFLSLPDRHSRASATGQHKGSDDMDELDVIARSADKSQLNFSARTIARSMNVGRAVDNDRRQYTWEIERDRLKFIKILDEGQFGLVWRCELRLSLGFSSIEVQSGGQLVAVKTLKNKVARDSKGRDELLAEIEIMKLVSGHPNVVKILHCCTKDSVINNKPILLVMEYVELGKLQMYLEKSRNSHHYATNTLPHGSVDDDEGSNYTTADPLTSRDLIKFIYHVAKGMEYIASKCVVHRDLASRNILVSSQRICKIGDFGMARHMQSFGGVYERHSRNTKIPVRWMAPEVLLNNRFTTQSDVYSFGILMWEIVTLGSTPYSDLKTEQVIPEVARKGRRPDKPKYCHSQLYAIMSRCWTDNPDERPTFNWLVKQFDELLLSANNYIELDQYPDHDYYNICKYSAPDELL